MERLRELREARGLLQKDVAEHLGVDRSTYVKEVRSLPVRIYGKVVEVRSRL